MTDEQKNESEKREMKATDVDNLVYALGEEIGRGGQGAVFRVKDDEDLAVKLVLDAEGNPVSDNAAVKNVSEKLNVIRLLPIPREINLSRPLAILKSHAGYVMSFMSGMKSFDSFLKLHTQVKEDEIPSWLKGDDGKLVQDGEIWANYCKTGGLRTRLLALYKVSELLASLHANGLVYGDISCGNLMFKKSGKSVEAGLIDADNINFAGKSKSFFTPGYGAPEIVMNKSGATIFSDCYSFAVAAFYVLTMMHPFKGQKVLGNADEDDDWAKTVASQEKAAPNDFKDDGSFPWIFDSDDDSNSYGSEGQVRALFLKDEAFRLFDNTFSAAHTKSALRTPTALWAKVFADSADVTVECPSCKMTYYYDNEEEGSFVCPYCSEKRGKIIIAKSFLGGSETPSHIFTHEISRGEVFLPSRCFEPFRILKSDNLLAGVAHKGNALEIRSLDDEKPICISKNGGEEKVLAGIMQFEISDGFELCLRYKNQRGYIVHLTVEM